MLRSSLLFLRRKALSSFANLAFTRQKGLVLGAYEGQGGEECTELSPAGEKLDAQLDGKLRSAINGLPAGIGKVGEVVTLSNLSEEFPAVAVAGLGSRETDFNSAEYLDEGRENVRIATGLGARTLQSMGVQEIAVEGFGKAEAAAEGATLGVWYYTDTQVETKVELHEADGEEA